MSREHVILSSPVRWPRIRGFRSRARLFADRIELSNWRLTGRRSRAIDLRSVADVEWWTAAPGQPNLRIRSGRGEEYILSVKEAALWCFEVRRLAGIAREEGKLPQHRKDVADAA